MSIAAEEQVNCLDYTYSKIVRQSLGLLACAEIYFLLAVPYMYMEKEKNMNFLLGLSQSLPKEMGIVGFIIVSGERHITPLSILMSITFFSLGLKRPLFGLSFTVTAKIYKS